MKKTLTALGGDIFAGSFTWGVLQAGYKVLAHVEHSTYGHDTARLNFPSLPIIRWRELEEQEFYQARNWHNVDLMYCNPPCAPWSSARRPTATRTKPEAWRDDERVHWTSDLANLGRTIEAKTWVWESIINTWQRGREFVDFIAEGWAASGYSMSCILQNNMYTWGTQNRKRIFVVAHKYPLVYPEFQPKPWTTDELLETVHVNESEKRWLPPERKLLWEMSESYVGSLVRAQKDWIEQGHTMTLGTQSFLDYRLLGHLPPRVFLSDSTRMHPHEPRYFTWGEMKALCGLLPSWQTAEKSMNARALELSRAVLCGTGAWIATAVKDGLKHKPIKHPVHQIFDMRDPDNGTVEPWTL